METDFLDKSPASLSQPTLVPKKSSRLRCRAELARSLSLVRSPHSDSCPFRKHLPRSWRYLRDCNRESLVRGSDYPLKRATDGCRIQRPVRVPSKLMTQPAHTLELSLQAITVAESGGCWTHCLRSFPKAKRKAQ